MNTQSPEEKKVQYLRNWFMKCMNERSGTRKARQNDEELYFSDVDGNRTQFTNAQLDLIKAKYDVPISTKIAWPIVEQLISLTTGSKPYARLIATTDATKQWTETYEKAHLATWVESNGNGQLTQALRDMYVVGSGFLHVRRNHFFNETTFNVALEYLPWQDVYVDPNSRKRDFSDAEMIVIGRVRTKSAAEKEHDIEIGDDELAHNTTEGMPTTERFIALPDMGFGGSSSDDFIKYVWERTFYEKKVVNLYISEKGDVSAKRPKQISLPNPAKEEMGQMIAAMRSKLILAEQQAAGSEQASNMADEQIMQAERPEMMAGAQMGMQEQAKGSQGALIQMREALQNLEMKFAAEPDEVPAYEFERLDGSIATAYEVRRTKDKKIKRTLMIGNRIYEEDILPCEEYPVVHFCISHMRAPDKTYGVMHYIKDLNKAMNRLWGLVIYDMQINGSRKVLAEESMIQNKKQFEESWAQPGTVTTYTINEELAQKGLMEPKVIDGSPLNMAASQLIQMAQQLAEYVTGMYGVVQGNSQAAPDTFGGIQNLQTFGTQRVKLYGRYLEESLQQLALVLVSYLQAYAPRGQVLRYIDDDGNEQELQIMADAQDLKFKVRVNMTSNLPTTRHMAAQILATIAGQTPNPQVAEILTQYMLKVADVPEADKIAEEIDVVKRLTGQIQQMQQALEASEKKLRTLENNNFTSEISAKKKLAEKDIEHEADLQKQKIQYEASASPEAAAVDLG